ncbi:MAG TPA: peptidoglycan DD-metalloendopeptidase family protein [Allosphingosinicella sp.]|jgi:murein DD-endopeptidase MepM/ murein hydrolase activator NlpD
MSARHLALLSVLAVPAAASSQPDATPATPSTPTAPATLPAEAPAAFPFFQKPFAGDYPVLNVFDHDLPLRAADNNRRAVDWRGRRFRATRAQDGHAGYDFAMPVGTPLLAAAAGTVTRAGQEDPHPCHLLSGLTSGLWVQIRHRLPDEAHGEYLITNYVHLSRVDVKVGDKLAAGDQLGLSGNTGCSNVPHLHFAAARQFYTRSGSTKGTWFDPSGWRARKRADPWALDPRGVASTRMWIDGKAPAGL